MPKVKKIVSGPIIGFFTTPAGIGFGLFYTQNSHPSILAMAILFTIIGLFFLGRSLNRVMAKLTGIKTAEDVAALATEPIKPIAGGLGAVLEQNNATVKDYNKTAKTRDQLKMMSISGQDPTH